MSAKLSRNKSRAIVLFRCQNAYNETIRLFLMLRLLKSRSGVACPVVFRSVAEILPIRFGKRLRLSRKPPKAVMNHNSQQMWLGSRSVEPDFPHPTCPLTTNMYSPSMVCICHGDKAQWGFVLAATRRQQQPSTVHVPNEQYA